MFERSRDLAANGRKAGLGVSENDDADQVRFLPERDHPGRSSESYFIPIRGLMRRGDELSVDHDDLAVDAAASHRAENVGERSNRFCREFLAHARRIPRMLSDHGGIVVGGGS